MIKLGTSAVALFIMGILISVSCRIHQKNEAANQWQLNEAQLSGDLRLMHLMMEMSSANDSHWKIPTIDTRSVESDSTLYTLGKTSGLSMTETRLKEIKGRKWIYFVPLNVKGKPWKALSDDTIIIRVTGRSEASSNLAYSGISKRGTPIK